MKKSKKTKKRILSWLLTAAMLMSLCLPVTNVSAQETANDSGFFRGVCGHSFNRAAYSATTVEKQLHLAANLGADMYRVDVYTVSEAGMKWLDNVLTLCEHYGMEPLLIVYSAEDAAAVAQEYGERVTYYQLKNELDDDTITGADVDGTQASHYDSDKLSEAASSLADISAAIRANDTEATLIVNGTYKHYYYIQYLIDNNIDFDWVGWDWYSRMDYVDEEYNFINCIDDLEALGKPYMFTELNDHPEVQSDMATSTYVPDVISATEEYCNESVNYKGTVIYELLDEPECSDPEDKFGLVSMNSDGSIGAVKDVYTAVQELFGGGNVPFHSISNNELPLFSFEVGEAKADGPYYHSCEMSYNTTEVFVSDGMRSLRKPLGNESVYANTFYCVSNSGNNLTGYKTIKIDMFVTSIDTYNAYWNNKLVLQFYNGEIGNGTCEGAALSYPITQELKQGWNTISIDISEVASTLTDIRSIRLYTGDPTQDLDNYVIGANANWGNYIPTTDDCATVVYFDNCRASFEMAEANELLISSCEGGDGQGIGPAYTPLDPSYNTHVFAQGKGSICKPLGEQAVYYTSLTHSFNSVDLSGYQTLKFDMYIPDIVTYNTYWDGNLGIQLFTAGDGEYSGSQYYSLLPVNLKQGWNTITLSIAAAAEQGNLSNIGLMRITPFNKDCLGVGQSFINYDATALPTDSACRMSVYIDNLRAINGATVTDDTLISSCEGGDGQGIGPGYTGFDSSYNTSVFTQGNGSICKPLCESSVYETSLTHSFNAVDLSGYQTLEFDMYIPDIDTYNTYWSGNLGIQLFEPGPTDWTEACYYSLLPSNLKQGWNTITLSIADASAVEGQLSNIGFMRITTFNKDCEWVGGVLINYNPEGATALPTDSACRMSIYIDNLRASRDYNGKIDYSFNKATVNENILAFESAITAQDLIKSTRLENTFMKVSTDSAVGTGSTVKVYDVYGKALAEYQTVLYGDVDGDGAINASDITTIKKVLLSAETLDGLYSTASDANHDGSFDILDLIRAKKKAS